MRRASIVIRTLFGLCLLAATFNHARAILQHGLLWDYGLGNKLAVASKVFWGALTILDPLAVLLLIAKPRAGIGLTVGIMVSDVMHNTYYVAVSDQWHAPFFLAQVGFLVAVFGLAPIALRASRSSRHAPG